jgi:[ribosomal protein S18]-alanine N-acetyltransferase
MCGLPIMSVPDLPGPQGAPVWRLAGGGDGAVLAAVSRAAFDPDFGESWSARQLEDALALPANRMELAIVGQTVAGFALSRAVLDEAELLLCATLPGLRRLGIGRALVVRMLDHSRQKMARRAFLEVRENNVAAQGLYRSLGFAPIGRRRAYYRGSNGQVFDAITFECPLQK